MKSTGWGSIRSWYNFPVWTIPARVKDIMQSTAMLEIRQSMGGPYSSEQAALQQNNGVLPPDTVLMPGRSIGATSGGGWSGLVLDFASFGSHRPRLAVCRAFAR